MIFAQSYKNLSYLQKKKGNFSSFIKEKQYLCTLIIKKYDMPQSPKSKDEKSAILKPACHYVFLSPIFDSISKKGYKHSFFNKDLEEAGINGIINERVVALGGVTPEYIPQLRAWNFGGAAFLGDIWNRRTDANWKEYLAVIKQCYVCDEGKVEGTFNGIKGRYEYQLEIEVDEKNITAYLIKAMVIHFKLRL